MDIMVRVFFLFLLTVVFIVASTITSLYLSEYSGFHGWRYICSIIAMITFLPFFATEILIATILYPFRRKTKNVDFWSSVKKEWTNQWTLLISRNPTH